MFFQIRVVKREEGGGPWFAFQYIVIFLCGEGMFFQIRVVNREEGGGPWFAFQYIVIFLCGEVSKYSGGEKGGKSFLECSLCDII